MSAKARFGILIFFAIGCSSNNPQPTGDSSVDGGTRTPRVFCYEKEGATCDREAYVYNGNAATFLDQCRAGISTKCSNATCLPSPSNEVACLEALRDVGRVQTPSSQIAECSQATLCP